MTSEKVTTFSDLKLNSWLIKQCATIGVKTPTPIQENCIPQILAGKDCIGAAKTGSGKTLAFALPILQELYEDPYGIFALILTPTRELAFQIADQFAVIGKPVNIRQCTIIGGMDMVQQGKDLAKKPHIVVSTPGRLADHIESCNTFNFNRIRFLVLDEADRLLSGDFDSQLKTIFDILPKKKQSLFFSATITDTLEKLKGVTGNEVFLYEAPNQIATVEQLQQHYVLCPKDVRDAYLVETIRTFRSENETGSIMIFTDSCKKCQVLSMMLNSVGFENVALHAMITQSQRLAALARFKSNIVKMLIATDVASRGLDIPTVQLVFNHILPKVPKEYVHRVGRTARAGRGGMAISLVTPYDIANLHSIEEHINTKLTEYKIDDSEVGKIFTQVSVTKSEAVITLDEDDFYERKLINKKKQWILDGLDPDEEEEKFLKKLKKHKKPEKKNKDAQNTEEDEAPANKIKKSKNKIDDSEVGKIFTQVSVTKSEAVITLDEDDFYERKLMNKRKQWILDGLDPDEKEEKFLKKLKKHKKPEKKNKDAQKTEEDEAPAKKIKKSKISEKFIGNLELDDKKEKILTGKINKTKPMLKNKKLKKAKNVQI